MEKSQKKFCSQKKTLDISAGMADISSVNAKTSFSVFALTNKKTIGGINMNNTTKELHLKALRVFEKYRYNDDFNYVKSKIIDKWAFAVKDSNLDRFMHYIEQEYFRYVKDKTYPIGVNTLSEYATPATKPAETPKPSVKLADLSRVTDEELRLELSRRGYETVKKTVKTDKTVKTKTRTDKQQAEYDRNHKARLMMVEYIDLVGDYDAAWSIFPEIVYDVERVLGYRVNGFVKQSCKKYIEGRMKAA